MAAFFMLAAWLAAAAPAVAAPPCMARGDMVRGDMVRELADKYREVPVAVGVTNAGGLVEVLTTADGGTWSIVITTPQGMSCLVAAGEGWKTAKQPAEGEAS